MFALCGRVSNPVLQLVHTIDMHLNVGRGKKINTFQSKNNLNYLLHILAQGFNFF